jgi:hypothetical protein
MTVLNAMVAPRSTAKNVSRRLLVQIADLLDAVTVHMENVKRAKRYKK